MVVGIGASAGGLQAVTSLLEAMPREPAMAFVVIQHLDPTKKSLTAELLGKHTDMAVAEVEDARHVEPDHVYVIPPNKYLSISDGELHLSEPDRPRAARMAIDFFLRSLAAERKHRAVGIVLSGTGTDGTLGIKAIKASGGLTIAQDPTTAEHEGMPRSAIETGAVDHVLPPDQIPEILARYARHPYVRGDEVAAPEEEEREPKRIPPVRGMDATVALLRSHTGNDFSHYKEATLVRRIQRRMGLHHIEAYDDYLNYLDEHEKEIAALSKDLLISVTDFFREGEAWEVLRERAIAPIVEHKGNDEPIRAWVPGCATGEEPYSVAMLFLEEIKRAGKTCPLQVFGSDVDEDALAYARAGRYPRSIEVDISPPRLGRFFNLTESGDHYSVRKRLREAVVFADQNLIDDPPFSKLDLLCCRNVLIYLKQEAQERVLALFHFALRARGFLFLGSAETVGGASDLFETVDKHWRIYRRVAATRHDRVEFPIGTAAKRREIEPSATSIQREGVRLTHLAQQRLLEAIAPSAVLVDGQWQMLYICGDMDDYLTHKPGVPTNDLLEKARGDLRSKLRGAVRTALDKKRPFSVTAYIQDDAGRRPIAVTAHPVHDRDQDRDLALVVFEEQDREVSPGAEGTSEGARPAKGARAGRRVPYDRRGRMAFEISESAVTRQLEDELATTRQDLQSMVEQLESSNEELKAANEEAMSINEELQSSNEELETSKEELQSLNEELSTVNSQLSSKVEELESKQADMENLLAVTQIPTICLGTDLTIRWFTPASAEVIRLTEADRGRPLGDLSHDFVDADLVSAAERVLAELSPIEDEVSTRNGRTFLRRVRLYRTDEHRIGGVVITLVDITRHRKAEQALHEADRRKDEFLATLGHELRNPLASLSAALELTRMAPDPGTMAESRAIMERQVAQLSRLVDDLLEVSRITQGKMHLAKQRVELAAVVRSAVEDTRDLIDEAGHELSVRLPEEPIPLDADPIRLGQVLANLLNNAAKYTPDGGRIELAAERASGGVRVSVRDNGLGIPPDKLEAVFEMFGQVDHLLERGERGLGIGLSLGKSLVELHGGTIAAHSDGPGKGSEFSVWLPIASGAEAPPSSRHGDAIRARHPIRRRVLLVDNDKDVARSLARLVELLGHEIRVAFDGLEAMEAAAEFRPHLMLLDIGLPRLNGYDVARRIREQPWGSEIVITAFTGWGQESDQKRAREAGFDKHLTKPVTLEALQALLEAVCAKP